RAFNISSIQVSRMRAELFALWFNKLLGSVYRSTWFRYLASNSGRAYDSRKPHAEQRKVPTGTCLSSGAIVPHQNDFSGVPSTQLLTRINLLPPLRSTMNP